MWNAFAWIGIVVVVVLTLKLAYFIVETIAVARWGWDRWYRFRRRTWACIAFSRLPEDPDY